VIAGARLAACLVVVGLCVGCATSLALESLPADPIAALYWTREEARRRNEIIEELAGASSLPAEGIATPETLGSLFGTTHDRDEDMRRLAEWPGHLVLIDPRTGNLQRVDEAPPGARPLAWSADHLRLLYASAHGTGLAQLFEWNRASGEVQRLSDERTAHPFGDYHPDGGLLFAGVAASGGRLSTSVFRLRPDRGRAEVIVSGRAFAALRATPDGRSLLVGELEESGHSAREAAPVLKLLPLEPGAPEERSIGRGRDPDFSGDGRWLVYSARTTAGWRAVRARSDGSGRVLLGESGREESSPAASPDGQFVAHVAPEANFDCLFVRRSDGKGERLLSAEGSFASLAW
jgi:dipeptidyl aminopeptidase/acylaminoacyl peptidase